VEESGRDPGLARDVLERGLRIALTAEYGGRGADDLDPPSGFVEVGALDRFSLGRCNDGGDVSHAFNLTGNATPAGRN
jgi:hypothetical protein